MVGSTVRVRIIIITSSIPYSHTILSLAILQFANRIGCCLDIVTIAEVLLGYSSCISIGLYRGNFPGYAIELVRFALILPLIVPFCTFSYNLLDSLEEPAGL